MAMGEFAYATNSNRFLAAAPLQDQEFAVVGVPFDGCGDQPARRALWPGRGASGQPDVV